MKRIAIIAVVPLLSALAASACANDFDALFSGSAASTKSDAGKTPSKSVGSSSSSGSTDTGDDDTAINVDSGTPLPADLPDPSKSCGTPQTCDRESHFNGTPILTNTCTGCGCTCNDGDPTSGSGGGGGAGFGCENGEDGCTVVCNAGTSCTNLCGFGNFPFQCSFQASTAAGHWTCQGTNTDCGMQCSDKSICDLTCTPSTTHACKATCSQDSQCVIKNCSGTACVVDCQGGVKKDCGNGTVTCNKACP